MTRHNSGVAEHWSMRFGVHAVWLRQPNSHIAQSRVIVKLVAALVTLFNSVGIAEADDPRPVGSSPEKQWALVPNLSDEFNETMVNANKWRSIYSPPTPPGTTSTTGGVLRLTVNGDQTHNFFVSNGTGSYGFYEARVLGANDRLDSAFFLTSLFLGGAKSEIDVVEYFGTTAPNVAYFNAYNWVNDQPIGHGNSYNSQENLSAAYHVYGVDWNPNTIEWYVDGIMRASIPNTHWVYPMNVLLSLESFDWLGTPVSLPGLYQVDYIRVWAVPEPGAQILLGIAGVFVARLIRLCSIFGSQQSPSSTTGSNLISKEILDRCNYYCA